MAGDFQLPGALPDLLLKLQAMLFQFLVRA
jgi:hypothetical protein